MRFGTTIGKNDARIYKDEGIRLNMYELNSVNHGNITGFGQPGA